MAEVEAADGGASRPRRRLPLWIAGVTLLVLLAGAGAFFLLQAREAEAGEVTLQPTGSAGQDPFTDSVATQEIEGELAGGQLEAVSTEGQSVESVSGSTPELYGGTGEEAECDAEALVSFLEENPDKARAFAEVVGVAPRRVGGYVAGLTPVVLREDTRVTNHGFEAGQATPFESVMQAGTAVMVDERGVPRVRCACGNPLSEPSSETPEAEFTGERWEGFDEQRLVAVSNSEQPIDTFELVDVNTGETYEKAAGGGGLTVEELLNLPIPVENCELPSVPWEDGVHPQSGTAPDGSSIPITAEVVGAQAGSLELPLNDGEPQAVVGDVTGDGADDGIVTTATNCGSPATVFFDTYAFDAEGELLGELPVDQLNQGAFPELHRDLQVVDGGIEMTAETYTASDARAAPSITEQVRFEWTGSEFELVQRSSAGDTGSGSSAPDPSSSEDSGASTDWPSGQSGWTVVLASKRSRSVAEDAAERARSEGLSDVGLLRSDDHSSLNSGYWVAYSGVLSESEARAREGEARSAGFGDAYASFVSGD